jgi:hypothetical protein
MKSSAAALWPSDAFSKHMVSIGVDLVLQSVQVGTAA